MDQYVVLCYCKATEPTIVGFIDDDRATSGRFGFDAWPPQLDGVLVTPKKRGDRQATRHLKCPHCHLSPSLSHTTAAEVIDLIVRQSPDGSLRDRWGKTAIPFEDYATDDDRAAAAAEFEDMLSGGRDSSRPSDVPRVTRVAHFYVVPLVELRRLVSKLNKRR